MTEIELPKPAVSFHYDSGTIAGRLERHLRSKGVDSIGDPDYLVKTYPQMFEGSVAPIRFMDEGERRIRTYRIKDLSEYQVQKWHERERLMGGFILIPQLAYFFGKSLAAVKISEHEKEILDKFIEESRPINNREYDGFKVPAYFIYDNEFDALAYHHAWDWALWHKPYKKPSGESSLVSQLDDGRYGE